MKIRTKLLLGLSTLPIILLILLGTSWSQISTINEMNQSVQDGFDTTILVEQIHRDIKDEAILLRNLVLYNDDISIQEVLNNLQVENDAIIQNITLLETKVSTDEHNEMMEQLKNTNSEFNVYKESLIKLINEGKREEALSLMDENSSELHDRFFDIIKEFTTSFERSMDASLEEMLSDFQKEIIIGIVILAITIMLLLILVFRSVWRISTRLNKVSNVMTGIANGRIELSTKVDVISNDEIDEVAASFNRMTDSLAEQREKEQNLAWSKTNIAEIMTSLNGARNLESLAQTFLSKAVPLVESSHAVFYVQDLDEHSELTYKLLASYAFKERKHMSNTIRVGEGLIGQAVIEKTPIILTSVPSDYIHVQSGLGEAPPLNIYVLPILFEGDVKAVIEMASFKPYNETQQGLLEELVNGLGIVLDSLMGRIRLANLLEESQTLMEEVQAQSEELQNQQEELKATNEELEEQTQALRQSEEKLQMQQEELEQTNTDLIEKAKTLEHQNRRFEQTNREVEKARAELEEKAKQLSLSSKYKSEFLANMSHELRTPLNSLLILSKLLADNVDGNLSAKQVEFSRTIYSSGNDLLSLINDILDLAKIESGKMEVNVNKVFIDDIAKFVNNHFRHIAIQKKLDFNVILKEDLPDYIYSDEVRMKQVLKNLLSNAFKFTQAGEVTLEIDVNQSKENSLAFSVIDTGVGIPDDKQELIFEAFQQADGTTSRQFGGTGLGLSISREIANLLNGKLTVKSKVGKGSVFTFYISDYEESETINNVVVLDEVATSIDELNQKEVQSVIENENLVKNEELTQIKEENSHIKRVLIVDDDLKQRSSLMELIGDMDIIIKSVATGYEVIEELKVNHFDCLILDLGLTDTNGFELLERIKERAENNDMKVIVYTGRDLSSKEEMQLNRYAHTIIIKDAHSPQRLKAELELFVNGNDEEVHVMEPMNLEEMNNTYGLIGKKVLIVDDDVRNVYALSSILEQYKMEISFAENGKESLDMLRENPQIDLVLMDIMMPEMDGYEAIQRVREIPELVNLPIIALTAKAMKEDRIKCMEVGASDYIVKPVDPDQLISLIKVWLY
ncbi:response regulator [Bacillus sp. PS06]|uniref:response regulator n=1 Tax=Bacillus sp. PS06 TaxID=2764176 RepID=UPI001780527D|nr:response regulator [Bacillus sp. PS06]MBD8067390.1 response regulator [Bacillus sp. PS06]